MQIIKADTSVVVMLGPAVDKTDGVTLESGLVTAMDTATTGVRISKNGGAWSDRNGTVTTTVYDEGWYRVTLDTTDTSVEGTLDVMYEDAATCLPMMARLQVVNANVYNSLFAVSGTDTLNAAVTEWNGVALATTNPLPNAAADAAGGLAISDAGGLDLDGRLDAAVSSRMATFTQPTGFLAATFPTTVASTTNITAGTITTVSGNVTGTVGSVVGAVGSVTATVTADLDTIKTQTVTCAAGVTVNPSVGAATIQPTVTEFNARTQPTADYFDPAADTVVTVTNVTTTANVTNEVTADITKVSGSATAADNLEAASLGIVTGTAVTGTLAVGSCTTNLTEATDDHYIGRTLIFTSGVLAGQATDITDYTGSSKTLIYSNLTEAPTNGMTFVIV